MPQHLTTILEATGLACLVTAAWLTSIPLGLAATGAALIAISYALTRQPKRRPR